MKKDFIQSAVILVSIFVSSATAQISGEDFSLKPSWKEYSLSPLKIGVSFPKFPTADYASNNCENWERYTYAAFADDVVYTAVATRATKSGSGVWCRKLKRFGQSTFDERISDLMESRKLILSTSEDDRLKNRVRLSNDNYQIVLINDLPNKRFIELWITADKSRLVDESVFFQSLSTAPKSEAIDTKGGVINTIGDDIQRTLDSSYWKGIKPEGVDHGFLLVHKPKARYTDEARRNNELGTVLLKVSLLASGAIGTITPTKELRYGLTEEAIRVARRIVFIPKKVKGYNQSVIVTVEYAFNIY